MKRLYWVICIPFMVILTSCLEQDGVNQVERSLNPYGLAIVQTSNEYRRMVQNNPDLKLVNLKSAIPGIKLDIRYATTNNFTRTQVYADALAFLRRPAAEQLKAVQTCLADEGLGLIVYDAYRPYSDTLRFFKIMPNPDFCADPRTGSRHNRGCAVDVSLYDLKTGRPLPMPSDYDDFSERAHPDFPGAPPDATRNRQRLIEVMSSHGFHVLQTEWWHFDFAGWEAFPLTDLRFKELTEQNGK